MRFPDYKNPPLTRFSCTFSLSQAFSVDRFEQSLYRIYDKLRPSSHREEPTVAGSPHLILTNTEGLEISIYPAKFTISVSSQLLKSDFLSEASAHHDPAPPAQFSHIADWQTLKNFIAAALLQHPDPAHADLIELACCNEIHGGPDFESIGHWLRAVKVSSPVVPPALRELGHGPTAPTPLVLSACMAFHLDPDIYITVEVNKKAEQPHFDLIITSHKRPIYQSQGVDQKWYQNTMEFLDALRDANFLMFNCLLTDAATRAFGVVQAGQAVAEPMHHRPVAPPNLSQS